MHLLEIVRIFVLLQNANFSVHRCCYFVSFAWFYNFYSCFLSIVVLLYYFIIAKQLLVDCLFG